MANFVFWLYLSCHSLSVLLSPRAYFFCHNMQFAERCNVLVLPPVSLNIVRVRPAIYHFTVQLLRVFPLLPVVGFFSIFLRPLLPFFDLSLSSHNPPILAVVFLAFCNLLVSFSQLSSVICRLSFWPSAQPIFSSGPELLCRPRKPQLQFLLLGLSPIPLHRLEHIQEYRWYLVLW